MTTGQKVILSFLLVIAAALLCLVVWLYSGGWQRPLGPSLRFPTVAPLSLPATWTPDPNATVTLPAIPAPVSGSQASPAPTSAAAVGVCGAPAVMNILAIGTDVRGDNYNYGLAAVFQFEREDSRTPKVTVL